MDRAKLEFARDRLGLVEARLDGLAEMMHGWNISRVLRNLIDQGVKPARQAINAVLERDALDEGLSAKGTRCHD